jgi:hypothetical protein
MPGMSAPRAKALVLVLCGAVVASATWTAPCAAGDFVPAIRVQTGVTAVRSPGNDSNDYFVSASPELGYYDGTERLSVGVIYSFTGSLNTFLPNALANSLTLTTAYDVTPTTRLLLGADALQSSIGNYLLVRKTAATRIGGVTGLNTQLLALTATQGLSHELTSNLRLNQSLTGNYVTSLDPDIKLNNYIGTLVLGVSRSWEFDALGGELTVQYAKTFFPPLVSTIATAALGPTWDHDWSRTISTSATVSGAIAVSPDRNTKARATPAGAVTALYTTDGSGVELSYQYGFSPNLLLGTLLEAHQATLRAFTPLSDEYRVVVSAGAGYLRAKTLDLRTNGAADTEFEAVLHDADITWGVTDYLSLFLRYQFIGQTAGTGGLGVGTPALVRHGGIFGIELVAQRPERAKIQTRFPQRVDKTDALPPSKRK